MLSSYGNAIEIKLNCSSESSRLNVSGKVQNFSGDSIIEITDLGKIKFIFIKSDIDDLNNISISTVFKSDNKKFHEVIDESDKNKWEIFNKTITNKTSNEDVNSISELSIRVDRNTGQFFLKRNYMINNFIETTNAKGNCEKIDTTKKKF